MRNLASTFTTLALSFGVLSGVAAPVAADDSPLPAALKAEAEWFQGLGHSGVAALQAKSKECDAALKKILNEKFVNRSEAEMREEMQERAEAVKKMREKNPGMTEEEATTKLNQEMFERLEPAVCKDPDIARLEAFVAAFNARNNKTVSDVECRQGGGTSLHYNPVSWCEGGRWNHHPMSTGRKTHAQTGSMPDYSLPDRPWKDRTRSMPGSAPR